ncbi:uncharacterized protein LOC141854076 [Brevipalpus obovatus]|uniref:uncharacterized protein LOC141854076 n=1 Tax=Brevipalpus obovatus TaxID=246614 RepID=UPI003D9ED715
MFPFILKSSLLYQTAIFSVFAIDMTQQQFPSSVQKSSQLSESKNLDEELKLTLNTYCRDEDFSSRILEELDECDRIYMGEKVAIRNQCLKELANGRTRNEVRRQFCSDQVFRDHVTYCIDYKLRTKPNQNAIGNDKSELQNQELMCKLLQCRKDIEGFMTTQPSFISRDRDMIKSRGGKYMYIRQQKDPR